MNKKCPTVKVRALINQEGNITMKQNYINIFENSGRKITLAYSCCDDEDQALNIGAVEFIAIEKGDLVVIGKALIELAE